MVDYKELDCLIELFDDPDTVVGECVNKRLVEMGETAVRQLCMRRDSLSDESLKALIDSRVFDINLTLKLNSFANLVQNSHSGLSLFEGSYLVSSMLDPSLQRDSFEEHFFRCSGEYMAESSDQRTAVENIRIFNHIFFHRLHFNLADVDMQDIRYALISEVIKSRSGNPFAIAFLYIMISQLAGLPLRVLSFPGGFVPVYVENGKELFYINVYRNGEIFLKDRLNEFMSALGITIDKSAFKLRDESVLMSIYLESLQFIYSNSGDEKKCQAVGRALDILGTERFLSVDEEV